MNKPYPVEVTLESITPKLKFSFKPETLDIDSKGIQHVQWTKAKGSLDFTFAALAFYKANPFSSVVVDTANNVINALDNNHIPENHIYGVLVKVDRTYYNSRDRSLTSDGPTIRNK